ncbi:MAG: tetratricopeptide repeat protein, partial [Deltaproteobacteria bacterium]|nr:tetratricopeptide repeat protein [Deltaproteobacteria bacterium]
NQAVSLSNMGAIHENLGDEAKALEYFRRSLKLREEMGDSLGQAQNLNNIAGIHIGQKDFDQAKTCLGRAEGIVRERGGKNILRKILLSLGELELAQSGGEAAPAKALEHAGQALDLAGQLKSTAGRAEALLLHARIERSEEKFREAAAIFQGMNSPLETAKAEFYRGRIMADKEAIGRARDIFESLGARGWLARMKADR